METKGRQIFVAGGLENRTWFHSGPKTKTEFADEIFSWAEMYEQMAKNGEFVNPEVALKYSQSLFEKAIDLLG